MEKLLCLFDGIGARAGKWIVIGQNRFKKLKF
jgi:hypothetical protein